MAEYIKKEEIEQKIQDGLNNLVLGHDAIEILGMIYEMPSADVTPVRHGRWIWHSEERGYLCSECGSGCLLNYESDWHKSDWCPHCGAKMDLEG